jgi:hypothetical protein
MQPYRYADARHGKLNELQSDEKKQHLQFITDVVFLLQALSSGSGHRTRGQR